MRTLIVNADDLGINPQRTHGIFEAFEFGIVTSASLIVNGSDSATAAKHAHERKLPTGLHLNLTEGSPITNAVDVPSLLSRDDAFLDRHQLRRSLDEGTIDATHIERELRAQMEWFLDHRREAPTHVDGHHHIHIHPTIVPLLIPILLRYGIRFVRLPIEPLPPFGWEIVPERLEAAKAIRAEAEAARPLYEENGITSTDHFRGLALVGSASKKNLRHILARLPEGTTELMVHPGSANPTGSEFDRDPQRLTELAMLTDPELPEMLWERKITLGSLGEW
ncbi:ChbG/HpnK family deacetylase [Candidatus Peregrinibacteria bacterium]|nr:ChbG/HpnK family deacetylase [Candidatus Peregrinibacteria bacterium]